MPERRIVVWVQNMGDRPHLMLQWHDADGNRRSKSAGTCNPLDAERLRADLEADLNAGRHQEASRMSWEKFRELFEAEYVAARRANTRENYQAMFDAFERLCKPQALRSVTGRTVSQYAAALRKEPGRARGSTGQAPSTIRQRLALLRTALGWAVEMLLLPELPPFPSVKVPKKKPQPVAPELFERLLAKAPDDHMRAFLLAGWLGGLRLAEAVALEWEECDDAPFLDLAGERIVFPAEVVKGDEDQWVPLNRELRAALDALPRHGKKVFRFVAKDGHAICLNGVGERVIRLARKAGVKLTMHSLRKGFGCHYAKRVPAQVLQRLMRHSNIALTMNYYANVDDAVMEAVLGAERNTSRNSEDKAEPDHAESPPQPLGGESS